MPRPVDIPPWIWPGEVVQPRTTHSRSGAHYRIASIVEGNAGLIMLYLTTPGSSVVTHLSLEVALRDLVPCPAATGQRIRESMASMVHTIQSASRRTAFEHIQEDTLDE